MKKILVLAVLLGSVAMAHHNGFHHSDDYFYNECDSQHQVCDTYEKHSYFHKNDEYHHNEYRHY